MVTVERIDEQQIVGILRREPNGLPAAVIAKRIGKRTNSVANFLRRHSDTFRKLDPPADCLTAYRWALKQEG